MRRLFILLSSTVLLFAVVAVFARQQAAPAVSAGADDEEFARLVKQWTTSPEFTSPLVDHLPKVPGVPSPKEVLGYYIGEPKKLTYTAEAYNYYRTLASKSPRVKVLTLGKSDEGRDYLEVFVGSEKSIRDLDIYKSYLAKLADPRGVSDAQAREIIAEAKPIYQVTGGLHSSETGPPEMLMELAYRLATEDTPLVQQIRDNLIVAITPVLEPDGRDRYVDWYYRHRVDDTSEDDLNVGLPYWGKYVRHDNNRDINFSQVITKLALSFYLDWHPPIMHELHESVPLLYTFSGQAPQNPNLDPILYGELPLFANFTMSQMAKYGMPGVWTHGYVDMWSPGYLGQLATNHNSILRMFETFGNGGATTMMRHPGRTADGSSNGEQTTREWYRPWPAPAEIEWSMRDNTNYMETGVLTEMLLASAFPKVILENFYQKSRNSIEAGKKQAPYAYVIPAGQRDMTRAAWLLNILRLQGIEIGRAASAITLKDNSFPAGSYVVKLDQPYGRLAKILLEKQNFPDPNLRTYDDAAWTMGLMAHTDVREIADQSILDADTEPVSKVEVTGTMNGDSRKAAVIAVMHNGSNNLITLRYRLKDLNIRAAERAFNAGDVDYPAGSFLIPVAGGTGARVQGEVERLGLTAAALTSAPDVPAHDLDFPRVAIYSTWNNTQDVGWVRYAFDQFQVPFDLIYKDRVKQGNLHASYDLIIIPNQGRNSKDLVYEMTPKLEPLDYKKSQRFQSLGMYGETDDIAGGMGLNGVEELQRFVAEGGVLVTLGTASFMPTDFGLTRNIDASRPSAQFYAPGPIIAAEILQPSNPIFYGYPDARVPVRYANGPLLHIPEENRGGILMKYPGGDGNVLSGLMKGAQEIRDQPAIVSVPVAKGGVILFAGNPCYRWQNYGEFNMLFNTVMNSSELVTLMHKKPQDLSSR
jgi:hypothetical protein